ncbi:phytoene desaturase family protein [Solicola gregarius]|uniref:Pyridine nucleotide-disulfide oxidoreductase domain-containing protein 2 n=1 Tax=Solicola gregarius TaxID=2908642 RepID=A0AA46TF64_9ACTN|nr:NAD(P)/FAD-dependent oxidoreductase [Solicola gregarius]UYM04224.1 NAD(P)/FAD-dependent oxidoreductase [Solicola gregarius]
MAPETQLPRHCDVAIVGGGHNALVAAAYLSRAGLDVVVLERSDHVGGAAVSERPFPGVDARLSRYSYLVSVMPDELIAELGLNLDLRSRPTASFTPTLVDGRAGGLYVEQDEGPVTADSFRTVTGSDREYDAWRRFYAEVGDFAQAVAPTLLEPLPAASDVRTRVDAAVWRDLVEEPLGHAIENRFDDDLVRGVVATDALIGTFASLSDPTLIQNRCFLYHLVGNGTGEWRVPVGGMGAVTAELARVAREAGARLVTGHPVTSVELSENGASVAVGDATLECDWVLGGIAPAVLDRLRGVRPSAEPRGAQLKLNLLVDRLPRLRSGVDPALAFAGTLHVGESYAQLQQAYDEAAGGVAPRNPPGELYCHTLTDPSILSPELAAAGAHTLTYFGLHMPPEVFEPDVESARSGAVHAALTALDAHLDEPIESVLARDENGDPCIEAKTPQDVQAALEMPGGHIFHGDLSWPWREDRSADDPASRWGVATDHPRLLLCGSGAQRGGAVSGIGGHNAAMALLEAHG